MEYFINYGRPFDRTKFQTPTNIPYDNKPSGGYWASPTDTDWGWRDFVICERMGDCAGKPYTVFKLKSDATVIRLRSVDDVRSLPSAMTTELAWWYFPDFEKLVLGGVDAIVFYHNNELHDALYGWDCDSILVLNPDSIVIVGQDEIKASNIDVSTPSKDYDDDESDNIWN